MEWKNMFALQRDLDRRIESQHGLTGEDLFDRKVLALLVEIGELANETRCFKFWSEKPASPKAVILEEFVDGVHLILSLGIELGFDRREVQFSLKGQDGDVNGKFLEVFERIRVFRETKSWDDYQKLVESYFELGELLGFSEEDVYNAYLLKNEVNHQRQDEGY